MTYNAAKSIQEAFMRDEGNAVSDAEAEFIETFLWYEGFQNPEKIKLIPYHPHDVAVIMRKIERARAKKDFKTSDDLREVLRKAGIPVKNTNTQIAEPEHSDITARKA